MKASGDADADVFGSKVPVLRQQQIFKRLFILTNLNRCLQPCRKVQTRISLDQRRGMSASFVLLLILWEEERCWSSVMLHVLCILPLKGKRTLGLLVENCGRVNFGKTLDDQRKGTYCFCRRCSVWEETWKKQIKRILRCTRKVKAALTHLSGLVGDIELNKQLLRDFIIHSLDMKPGFVNRFVSFNYDPLSLLVCVPLSLHLLASDSVLLIKPLLCTIRKGPWWKTWQMKMEASDSGFHFKHLKLWRVQQVGHS